MAVGEMKQRGKAGDESGLWLRLFFALELPLEIREAATAHAARLRRESPAARASWPRPENLHLTLKFLGEVEAIRLDALHYAGANAAAWLAPFPLTIQGTGTFPTRDAARVLWLGVRDDANQLARLQFRLDLEGAHVGFPRESKPFRPHLTLARVRPTNDVKSVATLSEAHRRTPFGPYTFQVSELALMRSELGPGGPRYTPLQYHSL